MTQQQRAVLMMTPDQVRASWVREQEYRRARGESHYTRLVDPVTNEVYATVEPR